MSLPGDPVELVLALFSADRATLGYRTLLIAMEIWETSGMTTTVKVLIRSLLGSDQTLDEYRQWLDTVIITPAARLLGGKNAKYRIESGLAHILGLMLVRYMTQAEPIASMPREELARLHAPTVQVLFTGHVWALADHPLYNGACQVVPNFARAVERKALASIEGGCRAAVDDPQERGASPMAVEQLLS